MMGGFNVNKKGACQVINYRKRLLGGYLGVGELFDVKC